jgi:3'-phosphoadenosine 5'-phosphosulfate sulfotransferase (PAPS reductase)/FAD synthetase
MYDYLAEGALPNNEAIKRAFVITEEKLKKYKKIQVALSGGSDSDIMLDIIEKCRQPDNEIYYVFYNTGLDFDATRAHIKYLEEHYGITIIRQSPKKSIPTTCREHGQPFLSKKISDYIGRLQAHGFQWEDEPLDVLTKKYSNCLTALKWWTNEWGENSQFNIERRKFLKEFMIANPPTFKISAKCCDFAKKMVAKEFHKQFKIDMECTGVRKAEGGARATAYKNCFTEVNKDKIAAYRPLYYFKKEDKEIYKRFFNIRFSDCYEKYGMTRTGCPACPFSGTFDEERKVIETFEPKFLKAVDKIFGDAFEYQRAYYKFRDEMLEKEKQEAKKE